jgi:stage II sporulation SpoE-like protein
MESARRTGNVPSIPPSSSNAIDVFPLGPFPSCPAFPSEETPREPSTYFLYSLAMNREALLGLLSGGLVAGIGLWLLYRKRGWVDVSPQLRTMSVGRMKYLLAGAFFFGAAIAFVMDLFNGALTRPVVIGFALLFGSIFCLILVLGKFWGVARVVLIIPLGALAYYIETHNAGTAAQDALATAYRFDGFGIFYTMAACVALFRRHINTEGARQLRAETELELAHRLQNQLLLTRASQAIPGFAVESVYQPASEVGGDFFLLSPAPDGSLTAIVGDVSGKGLIAAMRVAMILGVLRREPSREPAEVLRGLNEALLPQGETSRFRLEFTTACCVHIEHSGRYRLANAGHISPFIDGTEIATPPALPLGLAAAQDYVEVCGLLPAGKRLVLMSDGVVEARSKSGELYGFERLAELTKKPAQEIADVAKRFGQEDDISVLTIACAAQ